VWLSIRHQGFAEFISIIHESSIKGERSMVLVFMELASTISLNAKLSRAMEREENGFVIQKIYCG
jgi:hypothetical protein